jgi:hypothetical protein
MSFASDISKQWIKNNAVFNQKYFKTIVCNMIFFKELERMVSSSEWYQNAFRANIVTYSLALFYNKLLDQNIGLVFNFDLVWKTQSMPTKIKRLFQNITYKVFLEITADVSGRTKNVTEWCKKEECWIEMKKNISIQFVDFGDYLKDKRKDEFEKNEETKEQKKVEKLSIQIEVVEKGANYWKKLLEWGVSNKCLFGFQYNIVKIAATMDKTGLPPSEKQSKTLFEILRKLELEGYKDS